jgi:hypothetical protein
MKVLNKNFKKFRFEIGIYWFQLLSLNYFYIISFEKFLNIILIYLKTIKYNETKHFQVYYTKSNRE